MSTKNLFLLATLEFKRTGAPPMTVIATTLNPPQWLQGRDPTEGAFQEMTDEAIQAFEATLRSSMWLTLTQIDVKTLPVFTRKLPRTFSPSSVQDVEYMVVEVNMPENMALVLSGSP